jgi:transcriptional regulator with XRE-family HTH domain
MVFYSIHIFLNFRVSNTRRLFLTIFTRAARINGASYGAKYGREDYGMSFNFGLVKEIMRRDSIKRSELASLLGISYTYLYMLEKGLKRPGLELVEKIAKVIGVPVAELLLDETSSDEDGGGEAHDNARTLVDLKNKVERERRGRLKAEKSALEQERKNERLESVIGLYKRFGDIVCNVNLTDSEKTEKLEGLSKAAVMEDDLSVSEIIAVTRVKRSVLKKSPQARKRAYRCRFAEGGEIAASNAGEAALCLRCFDCQDFDSGDCRGYGNEKDPKNIITLLARLRMHGVTDAAEHVRILEKFYRLPLTAHELSEVIYRDKNGLPIPKGIYYLDNVGRRR